jgi:nicotinate phosphoribosyltransferase
VARASYIAGFIGTSNVLAGKIYHIPVYGTMAHSFVVSFSSEMAAFRAFARTFPKNTILLVDTYDSLVGVKKAVEVGREMEKKGARLKGIRLDSGDITRLSQAARQILDGAGFKETMIFASGAFDEYKIQQVLAKGAQVDSFGVGTKMGVSADAPYMDMAYKLVQYNGQPVLKLSPGKMTLAGDKQVFRFYNERGQMEKDILGLRPEKHEGGQPLLEKFMNKGKIIQSLPSLPEIRERFLDEFARLASQYKEISSHPPRFPVEYSRALQQLQQETIRQVREKELGES